MKQSILALSVSLVSTQISATPMRPEEVIEHLRDVFKTLSELSKDPTKPEEKDLHYLRKHPLESIQQEEITCLESGNSYRLLSNRHLALFGLTPTEYKKKWGIPKKTALSARSLTETRRKLARASGMGKELAEWRAKKGEAA